MAIRYGFIPLSVALAILLAGLLFFLNPERAHACSCGGYGSPSEELEESAAVFRGSVTSASWSDDNQEVTYEFAVTAVWKGPLTDKRTITTPSYGAACGREFGLGEYIVYSWHGSRDGLCSRTRPISDAAEDLAELGEGYAPIPSPPTPTTPTPALTQTTSTPTPSTPTPTSIPATPTQDSGGGCGISPHKAEFSIVGLILGIVGLSLGRRRFNAPR